MNSSDAPSAQASNVRGLGAPEAPIRVRGMGRIAQATLLAATQSDGSEVFNEIITTSIFPRLSRIASAYQRYRFTKLDFNVQPMCPSITGGGYVAGFLKDPLDTDASFDALQGSYGAVVGKWWEHKTVQVRPPKDLLWTSVGENARLFSPGKFVLTTVGTNTDLVNVSVLCNWEAELSVPSLENTTSGPITEYLTTKNLFETGLVGAANEFQQFTILPQPIANGTILKSEYPVAVDYKLGTGDVLKAEYVHFRVNLPSTSFGAIPSLQWGIYDNDTFTPGVNYYRDGQPQQVLLSAGATMDVLFDPNA
jgi:hypothetical protein